MTRDDLFDELKMSVELLLEALDMTLDSSSPLNDAAKIVVAGFFKGTSLYFQVGLKMAIMEILMHTKSKS